MKFEPAPELVNFIMTKGTSRLKIGKLKRAHNATDSGHCIRKRVLQMFGVSESDPPSPQSQMTFAMGTKMGEVLALLAMRAGVHVDDETSIIIEEDGLEFPISVRLDVAIKDPFGETVLGALYDASTGMIVPVEYKTIKSKGFYSRDDVYKGGPKKGEPYHVAGALEMPKKDHVMQLHHYLHKDALNAPYGYIWYMCKDDQNQAAHRVYWNPAVWQDVLDEDHIVEEYYRAGIVPTREAVGITKGLRFYERGYEDKKPGDLNLNSNGYPCWWKGQDGGEPGVCSILHACWRDVIMKYGNERERAKSAATLGFQFKEGVLDIDLAAFKQQAEDEPAEETAEAPARPGVATAAGPDEAG